MDQKGNHKLSEETERVENLVLEIAKENEGDGPALLTLLRVLEALHWQVREKFFHPALPETRQELYKLLRNIEENGGWPYIERMKLRSLLTYLEFSENEDNREL